MTSVEAPMPTFDDLAKISKTLNEESNQINSLLTEYERRLVSLNLGVEVWLGGFNNPELFLEHNKYFEDGVRYERGWKLGYAEHGRQYKLMAKEFAGHFDQNEIWVETEGAFRFLSAAPRKHRVKALELMEELLGALQHEAQRVLDTIDKSKKTIEKL